MYHVLITVIVFAADHMDGRECIPDSAYRGLAYAYVLNYLEKSLDGLCILFFNRTVSERKCIVIEIG